MKLTWLDYLVYSFDNCAMKLCIETDLRRNTFTSYIIHNCLNLKTFFKSIIYFIEIGN